MKRRDRKPARPTRREKEGDITEREELRRRQAELDRQAPADTPDGLIVSNPGPAPSTAAPRK